jgi:hypothetical protein
MDFLALSKEQKATCVAIASDRHTIDTWTEDRGLQWHSNKNPLGGVTLHLGPLRWFNCDDLQKAIKAAAEFCRRGDR